MSDAVAPITLEALRGAISGYVISPEDSGYDKARLVHTTVQSISGRASSLSARTLPISLTPLPSLEKTAWRSPSEAAAIASPACRFVTTA